MGQHDRCNIIHLGSSRGLLDKLIPHSLCVCVLGYTLGLTKKYLNVYFFFLTPGYH